MYKPSIVLLGVALLTAPFGAACGPIGASGGDAVAAATPADGEAFAVFWPRFRDALLRGDAAAIDRMSADQVRLPAELEGEPPTMASRAELPALLRKVLSQESQDAADVTNRGFVERQQAQTAFGPGVAIGKNGARIGPFGFDRGSGGWKLIEVIVQPDE